MQGVSCLYRRPSGIYAVRLVVPKRLRESIGRTEIHTSTGVRSLAVAKTEALRIQLHWRKHFQAMDAEKLRYDSPLITGDGMICVTAAADAIGISPGALAGDLLNDRAQVYAHVQGLPCWSVPDLNDIEHDYDGGLILNDVEAKGVRAIHSGMVRVLDRRTHADLLRPQCRHHWSGMMRATINRYAVYRKGNATLDKTKLDFISALTDHLAWPLLVLILVLMFRNNLKGLLHRITSIKHGETELTFAEQSKQKLAGNLTGAEKDEIECQQVVTTNEHYTLYANGTFVQRMSVTSRPGETDMLVFPITFPNEATAVQVVGNTSARVIEITPSNCKIAYPPNEIQQTFKLLISGV
jgi:hypothetical protein